MGAYDQKVKGENPRTGVFKSAKTPVLPEAQCHTAAEARDENTTARAREGMHSADSRRISGKGKGVSRNRLFFFDKSPQRISLNVGIRFNEIHLPGCHVDLDAIEEELKTSGFPQRRGYFAQPSGKDKQQRCMLIPKY